MTTPRRITLAIVAGLAALLLSAGLTNAQEPPETATRLEPGLNLVGWVGEPTPVSQLFQQIPQLEAIWAWDAELRDWIVAAPGAPEWLGGLGRVTPGMGLRMQLGGDQPHLWRRSTEPTRGLVKLRTGWNLVAWSGADGAAIGDVVKGIGWSLRTVRRWDAANQQWITWTSPERSAQVIANTGVDQGADDDAETPGIRRGEALWINVARAVNWLQPTEILPRLVFPGGASQELQTRVREDLQATLSFFRDQYGIQAEPDFTVYAAKDVDALIQAYKDDGQDVDEAYEASERALWNRAGGWGGSKVVVKQSHWPEDLSTDEISWARYLVTHEYLHVLQFQLSDGWASEWLVEGTADWAEGQHEVLDGDETWGGLRESRLSAIADDAPTLRSTESENGTWHYTLGWLATDHLTADAGLDSPIEFWRQLAPTEIGPHRRWESTPGWQTVFHGVFGQPVSEFYAVFDAWQREQAKANPSTVNSYDGNWIRGRVRGENGGPVAGMFVNAIRVEGETSVGRNQRNETAADGTFAVRAPEDGNYRLTVDITGDCPLLEISGRLLRNEVAEQTVEVNGADVSTDVQLPPNACGEQRIRGRIVGPNAEPLAGLLVGARVLGPSAATGRIAASDGLFSIAVSRSSAYYLNIYLRDGCSVYLAEGGGVTRRVDERAVIRVADENVDGLYVQIPAAACDQQIVGRILDSGGSGLRSVTRVYAELDDTGYSDPNPTDDGEFTVTVPFGGDYRLRVIAENCRPMYYSRDSLTTDPRKAWSFSVSSPRLQIPPRQVPPGICVQPTKGDTADQALETTDVADWENTVELTIVASQHPDGRPELGVQLANGERLLPDGRLFPAGAKVGQWWTSSDVEVNGVSVGRASARVDASGRIELAFVAADGERRLPRSRFIPTQGLQPGRWLSSTSIEVPWPE